LDTFFWQNKRKYLAKGEIFAKRCNRRGKNDAGNKAARRAKASRRINVCNWHKAAIRRSDAFRASRAFGESGRAINLHHMPENGCNELVNQLLSINKPIGHDKPVPTTPDRQSLAGPRYDSYNVVI
jgi:hypothetical protein